MQLSKVHTELAEVKSGISFAMEDSKERQKIAEMHHMLKEAEVMLALGHLPLPKHSEYVWILEPKDSYITYGAVFDIFGTKIQIKLESNFEKYFVNILALCLKCASIYVWFSKLLKW